MQSSLTDFKQVYQIPSSKGDQVYEVVEDRGVWYCNCYHGQRGESHCRHILLAMNKQLRKENDYLKHRKEIVSKAQFQNEDEVIEHLTYKDDMEFTALIRITLELCKSQGYVSTEDVREAVGNKFIHSPAILGSVIGSLLKKGLIERQGNIPKRNKLGHRKYVGRYVLTEEGQDYV